MMRASTAVHIHSLTSMAEREFQAGMKIARKSGCFDEVST
jgi:hypothetical protein